MQPPDKNTNLKNGKVPLTMIELFSGIGAQKKGIDLTGLYDCKVIATSDIDKDVMVSYAAIHNGLTKEYIESYNQYPTEEQMRNELIEKNIGFNPKKKSNPILRAKGYKLKKYWLAMKLSNNLGDISKIKQLPLADFWTYSFPCQDISVAGKQRGIVKGETRSGLLYEVERLLVKAKKEQTLPKYLMLENVKNLLSKNFIEQFKDWIGKLDELGFNTYWELVNAKDCGIPQNRERVFAISIRKDIDKKKFEFMKPFDLGIRLIDFLESEVDEKYYLSEKIQERFEITDNTFKKNVIGTTIGKDCTRFGTRDRVYNEHGIIGSLLSTDYKQPKQTSEHDNRCMKVGDLQGGKWDKMFESTRRYYSPNGVSPTITTSDGGNREVKILQINDTNLETTNPNDPQNYRIRKLTPREYWRLMGFFDSDYEKAVELGLSNSTGYRQAGNSIVTNCITLIMEHFYKAQYDDMHKCIDEIILDNFQKP